MMSYVVLFAVVYAVVTSVDGLSLYYDFSEACNGCVYKTSGIGYMSKPSDCNKYFLCIRDQQRVIQMACQPGLYWNNNILACDWPRNVNCAGTPQTTMTAIDPCSIRKPTNDRRTYVQLSGGFWGTRRCEDWQMYDSHVCECVNDPCHGMKLYTADDHYYWQLDNGVWKVRPCALGTAYNETSCNCDIHSSSIIPQACRPVILLPLNRYYGISDYSGNNHHIDNHGVVITQNTAYWNGDSYLSVPYFTNGFYGNKLTISFYFKRLDSKTRVLLSNSICDDVEPSILIYLNAWGICFKLRNDAGVTVTSCFPCERLNIWQYVYLRLQDGTLTIMIPDRSTVNVFNGNIASTHCPLSIGAGTGFGNLWGRITWLTVYANCQPYSNRLEPTCDAAWDRNPENMDDIANDDICDDGS